jgi:hypothetical protein
LGGIIFAKMLATGKEKDPAIDADPELLQKARQNPKCEWDTLFLANRTLFSKVQEAFHFESEFR